MGATACPHPLLAIMRLIQGLAGGGGGLVSVLAGGCLEGSLTLFSGGWWLREGRFWSWEGGGPCADTIGMHLSVLVCLVRSFAHEPALSFCLGNVWA